jgi:hypothetical protein
MDAVNPLNYAPRPRAAQRFWRWVYRLVFVGAIGIAAIQWGSGLWQHVESLYWEQKCLHFLQPPSHIVFEMNRANVWHSEVCMPRNRFMGLGKNAKMLSDGTIFLHEMRRPDGTRCLLSLTFSPMFLYEAGRFRLQFLEWRVALWPQMTNWNYLTVTTGTGIAVNHWKFYAGQPDANNPSHFTFDYDADGTRHTCDGWLNNEGNLIVSQRP